MPSWHNVALFCLVGKSRGTFCVFLEKCCKESKHLSFWVSLFGGGPSYLAHGGGVVCGENCVGRL